MKYLEEIKSQLTIRQVNDLSDSEIERALSDCVCGHWLVPLAKEYRDYNLIDIEEVKSRSQRRKNLSSNKKP